MTKNGHGRHIDCQLFLVNIPLPVPGCNIRHCNTSVWDLAVVVRHVDITQVSFV